MASNQIYIQVILQKRLYRNARLSQTGNDASSNPNAILDPSLTKPSPQAVDRLVAMVDDQESKRNKFSRRRPTPEDQEITYINDRNAHFNRKISRAFDKYTKEIRDSFERGTAL